MKASRSRGARISQADVQRDIVVVLRRLHDLSCCTLHPLWQHVQLPDHVDVDLMLLHQLSLLLMHNADE